MLNDIQTSGVVDVWNVFHYNGGETFSSLQDEPEKRVNNNNNNNNHCVAFINKHYLL